MDLRHEELAADFAAWKAHGGVDADPLYTAFKHRNADWLEKYCAYMAVKKYFEGELRHDWPADVARFNERLLAAVRVTLSGTEGALDSLRVREVTRRRGVGQYLLEEVLRNNPGVSCWWMALCRQEAVVMLFPPQRC